MNPQWDIRLSYFTDIKGFGSSVAVAGDHAIVGAPGANKAYLFKASTTNTEVYGYKQYGCKAGTNVRMTPDVGIASAVQRSVQTSH